MQAKTVALRFTVKGSINENAGLVRVDVSYNGKTYTQELSGAKSKPRNCALPWN